MELLARSGVGRDINRHYYTVAEVEDALEQPLVQKQIELIRLRNTHPAFEGELQVETPAENRIAMQSDYMDQIWKTFDGGVRAIVPLFETEVRGVDMLRRTADQVFT